MLIFRVHAVKRMVQRRINEDDVKMVLEDGEVIPQGWESSIAHMSFRGAERRGI